MFGALMFATCYFLFDEVGAYIIGIILVILGILCITNKHIGEVLAPVGRILRSQFQVMQGIIKIGELKERLNKQKRKKQQEAQEANVFAEQEEIIEPMEEISIDPPIISNFTENYPVNEEEDKRIEVEEEDLITSPFIEETPPIEEPKKKRGEKLLNR